jgi:murein DD-endopeptidase MepM/ murein hydrolase activator NlpD|tara:strand:- start:53 stop:841 length:789 start_codon:yes stop_codon:yes gene_type:complete
MLSYNLLKFPSVAPECIVALSAGSKRRMTVSDRLPHDLVAVELRPGQMSRRRLLGAGLGAAAGLFAVERAVAALPNGRIVTAAGSLQANNLARAERIPPPTTTTTVPPVPDGQIMFPVDAQDSCWISDNFGDCRGSGCSRSHEGLDISGSRGADLYAVVTGRLTKQYVDSGLTYGAGNGWTLEDEENNITYKYFHMATHTDGLEVGDVVTQGDVIGTVGNTGTSGAGEGSNYHLHFEYRPNDIAQNPLPLLVRPDNCTFYVG